MSGAEIVGLAASVVQLADVGLRLSVKLFTFTRKIKSAEREIDALSHEIAATGAVLQQLGSTLSEKGCAQLCSPQAIATAKGLVNDCEGVFQRLEKAIGSNDPESHIEELRANLERLKSSLLVILQVLILAEQLRSQETLPILKDTRQLLDTLLVENAANEKRYDTIIKLIKDGGDNRIHPHSASVPPQFHSYIAISQSTLQSRAIQKHDLPAGLARHHDRIHNHSQLVTKLLEEVDSKKYKVDHAHRLGLYNGILDIHWKAWSSMRQKFGLQVFLKMFAGYEDVARHWADNEDLSPSIGVSWPSMSPSQESSRWISTIPVASISKNDESTSERDILKPKLGDTLFGSTPQALQISTGAFDVRDSRETTLSSLETPSRLPYNEDDPPNQSNTTTDRESSAGLKHSIGISLSESGPLSFNNITVDAFERETQQGAGRRRPRHREALSCSQCRNRKIRCDREKPCKQCVSRGSPGGCSYESANDDAEKSTCHTFIETTEEHACNSPIPDSRWPEALDYLTGSNIFPKDSQLASSNDVKMPEDDLIGDEKTSGQPDLVQREMTVVEAHKSEEAAQAKLASKKQKKSQRRAVMGWGNAGNENKESVGPGDAISETEAESQKEKPSKCKHREDANSSVRIGMTKRQRLERLQLLMATGAVSADQGTIESSFERLPPDSVFERQISALKSPIVSGSDPEQDDEALNIIKHRSIRGHFVVSDDECEENENIDKLHLEKPNSSKVTYEPDDHEDILSILSRPFTFVEVNESDWTANLDKACGEGDDVFPVTLGATNSAREQASDFGNDVLILLSRLTTLSARETAVLVQD